jgi:hypothetical protein
MWEVDETDPDYLLKLLSLKPEAPYVPPFLIRENEETHKRLASELPFGGLDNIKAAITYPLEK